MKLVRSALIAVAAFAGNAAAIHGGMAYADENLKIAQASKSCIVTVAYRGDKGDTRTKSTCVKGGEAKCNTSQNNFCAPMDHPVVISRTCEIVPSCPDTAK